MNKGENAARDLGSGIRKPSYGYVLRNGPRLFSVFLISGLLKIRT